MQNPARERYFDPQSLIAEDTVRMVELLGAL